jgi:hypothetical protein
MTIKHTPGPWAIELPAPGSENPAWILGPEEQGIARVSLWRGLGREQAEANAALMAAAPDLLAALKQALNYIENTEKEFGETYGCGNAARAAITKAEGRS